VLVSVVVAALIKPPVIQMIVITINDSKYRDFLEERKLQPDHRRYGRKANSESWELKV